jgi:hypothetical protein
MGKPGTKIGELCGELAVSRQTLYRHMDPAGQLILTKSLYQQRFPSRRCCLPRE